MSEKHLPNIVLTAKTIKDLRVLCSNYLIFTQGFATAPDDVLVEHEAGGALHLAGRNIAMFFPSSYPVSAKQTPAYKASENEQAILRKAAEAAIAISFTKGGAWEKINNTSPVGVVHGDQNYFTPFEAMDPESVCFQVQEIKQISFKRDTPKDPPVEKTPIRLEVVRELSAKDKEAETSVLKDMLESARHVLHTMIEKPVLCADETGDTMVQVSPQQIETLDALCKKIAMFFCVETFERVTFHDSVELLTKLRLFCNAIGYPEVIADSIGEVIGASTMFFKAKDSDNRIRMPLFTNKTATMTSAVTHVIFLLKEQEAMKKFQN